jgi:membrane-associated protease RseP (regulator of RpoE activity)
MKKSCLVWLVPLVVLSWAWAQEDTSAAQNGWLGVYTESLSEPMLVALNIDHGVLVSEVAEGSPAQAAGFESGDVIMEIDSERIDDGHVLRTVVRERPDKKVNTLIRRRGQEKRLSVTLAVQKRPEWSDHFGFPGFPDVMRFANNALHRAGGEVERDAGEILPLDSLRKQLDELRKELDQLKEQLKEQTRGK